eukprot:GHVU01077831.1.p2 GENE.GHVU01077831.1~~GHVU01077831.1.p2  ORF type:complete len:112 (+),score=4.89 GHVU01077831.1:903-1238(+)
MPPCGCFLYSVVEVRLAAPTGVLRDALPPPSWLGWLDCGFSFILSFLQYFQVFYNFAFALFLCGAKGLLRIFVGALRELEVEVSFVGCLVCLRLIVGGQHSLPGHIGKLSN